MPDAPEVTPEPAATAPETPAQPVEETKPETDWKARSREWENRAKANAEAAKELQSIKDRDLSDLQRAQKAADEVAQELSDLRRQNTLLAKGIPADLIPPTGSSPDELSEYADRLIAWRGTATPPPAPQPQPDRGQGARTVDTQAAEDAEWADYKAKYFKD